MKTLCRIAAARPMLALATIIILGGEAVVWLYAMAPPAASWLPWAARGCMALLAVAGLWLARAACRRAALAERDYVINDLARLHRQSRAVAARPSGRPEPAEELIATMRSARR